MKLVRALELEVRGTTNWQILSPRPLLLRNSAEPALASLEECDKHHLREPVMRCSKKRILRRNMHFALINMLMSLNWFCSRESSDENIDWKYFKKSSPSLKITEYRKTPLLSDHKEFSKQTGDLLKCHICRQRAIYEIRTVCGIRIIRHVSIRELKTKEVSEEVWMDWHLRYCIL